MGSLTVVVLSLLALSPPSRLDQKTMAKAKQYDQKAFSQIFDQYYQSGSNYYKNSRRREAVWCLRRSLEIRPELYSLQRFVNLLRDFDNPAWKRKRWKSPRESSDKSFKKKRDSLDAKYLERMMKVGVYHAKRKDPVLEEHARGWFLKAMKLAGGPYKINRQGCVEVGDAGTIPENISILLIRDDLITINDELWVRDSMLRSIQDVDRVTEARGPHCLVRTLSTKEEAAELLEAMEQAYGEYVEREGIEVERLLGLFVFPEEASYQKYCEANDKAGYKDAVGFANIGEGFAVTYEHESLVKTAVHEGAHLYHAFAYGSSMPSWYDEGFACFFGHKYSMSWDGRKLTTGRTPTRAQLAPLLREGGLRLALSELLHSSAVDEIKKDKEAGHRFYLQSWALLWFLTTTEDDGLSSNFENWETFCLGSGYSAKSASAAKLFDRLFAEELAALEAGFIAWMQTLPE